MSNQQANWYVIHTYSGYEMLVKDSLEKLIENNNLQENIIDIKIPTDDSIEEDSKGRPKVIKRKVMPCYVFIKMVYSNDMWYLITNTRGVTGFVGPQGKAIPLQPQEVKKMRLEDKVECFSVQVGDSVKILFGALEGFIGKVVCLDDEQQKAKINVVVMGSPTEVQLDYIQIEKSETEVFEEAQTENA